MSLDIRSHFGSGQLLLPRLCAFLPLSGCRLVRSRLIIKTKLGDTVVVNDVELAVSFWSIIAQIGSVQDDLAMRVEPVSAALAAHEALNVLNKAASNNLGTASKRAAGSSILTKGEISALLAIRRKANLGKHGWQPCVGTGWSTWTSRVLSQSHLRGSSDASRNHGPHAHSDRWCNLVFRTLQRDRREDMLAKDKVNRRQDLRRHIAEQRSGDWAPIAAPSREDFTKVGRGFVFC